MDTKSREFDVMLTRGQVMKMMEVRLSEVFDLQYDDEDFPKPMKICLPYYNYTDCFWKSDIEDYINKSKEKQDE